jgi:asparagine synthase (glutamine-hydrolysing)
MCGILGLSSKKGADRDRFLDAIDTLRHRGPDARGFRDGGDVLLGHRRLSIIDLSEHANQPMTDEAGGVSVVFNGEIYNFRELRGELEREGFEFSTHSDTEVLLKAYRRWGEDCLRRLNGMFAFGLHDRRNRRIFLARDRAGKKPLYYIRDGGVFAFSSEIKGLLRILPDLKRELDPQALNYYFAMGFIPGEMCIFRKIRKLPPAHALTYDMEKGELRKWRYWELPPGNFVHDERALLEELDGLLAGSVRLRMISDVPLGAFLSGGIDSSLVVAYMSRLSAKPVKTFSIGFEGDEHSELPYARVVADHFGTDHHEFVLAPDIVGLLPALAEEFDEPFSDSSMIPTYIVAQETRKYVTVALTGDGGDELFGGYGEYGLAKTVGRVDGLLSLMPGRLRKALLEGLAGALPVGNFWLRCLAGGKYGFFLARHIPGGIREGIFTGDMLRALGSTFEEPEGFMKNALEGYEKKSGFVESLMRFDFDYYLPDDVLVKVDRASMLVSLEARAPLLDYRIVEFAFGKVPPGMKVRGGVKKYLTKELAKKVLPTALELERKRGFDLPVDRWFKERAFRDDFYALLPDDSDPILERSSLIRLLGKHCDGKVRAGRLLFSVLVFQHWRRIYGV